jgi:hemolysin activation/secretion protein
LLAALIATCPGVATWAAPPPAPSAGTILQQAQPTPPPAAAPNNSGLSIEQTSAATLPSSVPFLVSHIEITGNTRIETNTLHALVASAEGQRLTLPELTALTARITDYYHTHGYPLARAIVPAQTLHDGVVRMEVLEARYGKIRVSNHSRVNSSLLDATLSNLKSGSVVTEASLDRSLLLLSDVPGLTTTATLKPGAEMGRSDLEVNAQPLQPFIGSVTVDDSGDRYTGRARIGAGFSLLNPMHQGDVLGLNALSSGSGMSYGRVSYDALVDGAGTRIGAGFSGLHYRLSGRLSDLDAYGDAQDATVFVKQPFVRGRDANLNAQAQYDHLQLNDDIGASDLETRRHLDNLAVGLSGDWRDGWLTGGLNTWAATWTHGRVSFDNAAAESADATGADIQGEFSKWSLSLGRLQRLGPDDALYIAASGQWANGNLDPSQQLVLGGPLSVRAYDVSAVSGDVGWELTTEVRHTFPQVWHGQWQSIAFVDDAHLMINKNVFAPGPNGVSLNGAGIGLNWAGPDQWTAGLTLAAPIGSRPELIGSTNSVRAWAQVNKAF